MRENKGRMAIKQVALKERISVEEVYTAIELAINVGMANPDPAIQACWAGIPRKGIKPTPEEVIVYMAEKVRSDSNELEK